MVTVITFRQDTFSEARQSSVDYTTSTGWRRWRREARIEFFADDNWLLEKPIGLRCWPLLEPD